MIRRTPWALYIWVDHYNSVTSFRSRIHDEWTKRYRVKFYLSMALLEQHNVRAARKLIFFLFHHKHYDKVRVNAKH